MSRTEAPTRQRPSRPAGLRYAQLARPALATSRARSVLAALALVGGTVLTAIVLIVSLAVTGLGERLIPVSGADSVDMGPITPTELALTLLLLPVLTLPAGILTARWVLGMSVGDVCSVTGRFRWGWYARCLLLSLVLAVVVSAVQLLLPGGGGAGNDGGLSGPIDLPSDWLLLLLVILVCVPPQAFAEEFVFRGVLLQIVGARWVRPLAAFFVPAITTSLLFALIHAPPALALLLAYTFGGVCYVLLCDRSGGLEASSAAHAAWNVVLFVSVTVLAPDSAGSGGARMDPTAPGVVLGSVAADVVLAGGLILLARELGIRRTVPAVLIESSRARS